MSWRKQYQAVIQGRKDRIARRKKIDTMVKCAFESGRNSSSQEHLLAMAKQEPFGLARQLLVRQQAQQGPHSSLFGSLGLGGLFGGAMHVTPQ